MTNKKNEKINPLEFLAMYQKMQNLNPRAFERVCGIIEGVSMGVEIAAEQIKENKRA